MRTVMKHRFAGWMAVLLLAAVVWQAPQVASAQIVHNNDVKIDGSLDVGFDSTGTAFGFDTIRLRENNLRIFFDDTSSTSSFPNTDWRLTANDSANGGLHHFSIEDATNSKRIFTVEANARAAALYVESDGDIGIGTSNPAVDVDIKTGNTPTVRLQQDGTSGFAPQTWDVAGNEAGFFVRDATSGSTLPFRIRAGGAPSSSIDIQSDGDVGIGTGSPDADSDLHLRRTTGPAELRIHASNATTQQARLVLENNIQEFLLINNGNRIQWFDNTNGFEAFTIRASTGRAGFRNISPGHPIEVGTDATNGNGAHVTVAGIWTNGSTRKSKDRITDLDAEAAQKAFDQLQPVTYYGKNADDEQYVGFIADDVPELVAMNDRSGIAAIEIAALLTKVVQQQRDTIAQLNERLERLEAEQAAE